MTHKTIIAGLVAVAFVAGSIMASGMAYATGDKNGKPFEALWDAIHNLETGLAEIVLTPGPPGPPGEDGVQGPQGEPAGAPLLFSSGNEAVDTTPTPDAIGQGEIITFGKKGFPMPASGTISNLYANSGVGPGIGETRTFTVKQSFGGDTGLECTKAGVSQTCADVLNSFAVTPGKQIWIEVSSSSGANDAAVRASVLFTQS